MARPTKSRAPATTAAAAVDQAAIGEAHQALVQRSSELQTIDLRYALDGDYDFARIDSMLPSVMAMSAASALWVGRALILVKEHEAKGTFHDFLEKHGLPVRTAQRYMALSRRFGVSDQRKLLAGRLGIAKALELLGETDADIDALASDDDSEIYSMSREEIRRLVAKKDKQIEKAEHRLEAADEVIAAKDKKINELTLAAAGRDADSLLDQAKPVIAQIDRIRVDITAQLVDLGKACDQAEAIFTHARKPIDPLVIESIDGARQSLAKWLNTIASALGE